MRKFDAGPLNLISVSGSCVQLYLGRARSSCEIDILLGPAEKLEVIEVKCSYQIVVSDIITILNV